jgi:hypothetical protein
VNARAEHHSPPTMRTIAAPRSEHISLESSVDPAIPARPPHRKARCTFALKSSLRGCRTEVSVLEDHYLAVRSERWREPQRKYVLDLRFANPQPVRVRRIAWVCLGIAVAMCTVTAASCWWALSSATDLWSHPGALLAAGGAIATVAAILLFLRRTTEALEFTSVHGAATLVSILGGIGSAKSGKRFFIEMIKSIHAAKVARPQSKQQFLRDEMREHHRLRELNVLTQAEYEASKQRILAAHS